jgi:hypothetical protein
MIFVSRSLGLCAFHLRLHKSWKTWPPLMLASRISYDTHAVLSLRNLQTTITLTPS